MADTISAMGEFLRAEVAAGRGYLPAGDRVLRAFSLPLPDVRVLIVGQDPYPTPGHPVGLSFSVAPDVQPVPRSLQNIYAELGTDLGLPTPRNGDLTPWFESGVMLLNRVLTVPPGRIASHQGKGWETVTAQAISALVERGGPLVAILWGRQAQSLAPMLGDVPRIESRPPVPAVGPLRLLRLAALQPHQRPARPAGRPTHRLEADMTQPAPEISRPTVWTRYVAIGDSFTEGMCDDDPTFGHDGEFAGWADRLASHLSEIARTEGVDFGYANLAVRGRKLADVVGPQLEDALSLQPDLVSIVGGGNDILRPKADLDGLAARLEAAVARIRATGADVLMATPVDPADAPLVKATRGRAAIHTANIWSIARRNGAHVIDQWGLHAAARLADVERRPHPHDDRGAPPRLPRRARGPRPHAGRDRLGHPARARPADRPPRGPAGQRPVGQGVRRPVGPPPPHRTLVRRPPPGQAPRRRPPRP